MDPSKRNAQALRERVDATCDNVMSHFYTIMATAKEDLNTDYSTSASKQLTISEESTALVRSAQDLSTLIRDLQELWLFGGLDTLTDPADKEADKAKALGIAAMIEALAKKGMPPKEEEKNGEQKNGQK